MHTIITLFQVFISESISFNWLNPLQSLCLTSDQLHSFFYVNN